MKILLLNQYCAPDIAPTGWVMFELACQLSERGHDVTIICSGKSYNGGAIQYEQKQMYQREKLKIIYLSAFGFGRNSGIGKILDYASFYLLLCFKLIILFPRPDLVLSLTTPPYLGVLAKCFARLCGAKNVNWVLDLYPDVMKAHGMIGKKTITSWILKKLTCFEFKGSSLVIAIGPCMVPRIHQYIIKSKRNIVRWIPLVVKQKKQMKSSTYLSKSNNASYSKNGTDNYSDSKKDNDYTILTDVKSKILRHERGWKDDDLIIMYSGNMGLGHLFQDFLSAALRLKDNNKVKWVFAGGGKKRNEIEKFINEHPHVNITLMDYVDSDVLATHLRSADIQLISLDPKWQGGMLPSKLQTVFSVARPALFVGDRRNSIAQWIQNSGGGWVVKPDDVDGIVKCINEASNLQERRKRAIAAADFAVKNFNEDKNNEIICNWLEELLV